MAAGRPSLGGAVRSVMANARITKDEAAVLTAKYGSPGKAIRAFVNSEMAKARKAGEK